MIVEAGYDLMELLHPRVPAAELDMTTLRIVTLDADLRVLGRRIVPDVDISAHAGALLPGQIGEVIAAAAVDDARYFAIGHPVPRVRRDHPLWLLDVSGQLDTAASARGLDLLGYLVFDGEYWCSTGPVHEFRSYPGTEDMPRAVVIPGPHPFLDCNCLACQKHQRINSALPLFHEDDRDARS